jgi:hypothetical protein
MANETTNTPSHIIYSIRDRGEGKKASWTDIGCGWTNKEMAL